jgi:hypothetical protein
MGSLEKLEYHSYRKEREPAAVELINLLRHLDRNFGRFGPDYAFPSSTPRSGSDQTLHLATRTASALSALLSDPDLNFAQSVHAELLALQRWLSAIFAASPFGNADHVLRSFNMDGPDSPHDINLEPKNLFRYCLLYHPNSELRFDLDSLWRVAPTMILGACISLLSARFLGTHAAHEKREQILPWLARKLANHQEFDQLPIGVLHDVYMHCSYADRRDKHDVKRSISLLLRRELGKRGIRDIKRKPAIGKEKPVLLVVLEWFTSGHSIYRTHSRTMESARQHFRVVAMGMKHCVDETTVKVFDEFIPIEADAVEAQIREIREVSERLSAQILYMPSVGMFPLTMWLATVRSAPVQIIALGHPATTHSPAIDYAVVEEDYVGDPACFSEKLLILPSDGMPYRPSAMAVDMPQRKPRLDVEPVRIAVCSTTMKLNPGFLRACAAIRERSKAEVHFEFLIGLAQGLVYPQVNLACSQFLGNAVTVHEHQPYASYMEVIANCDMFINPFPFGNTNGIIDTVSAGLIGVCLSGPEVHEHIDEGIFDRLGFPSWLTTHDVEEYIAAAVRLTDNHLERFEMRKKFSGIEKVQRMFAGRPEIMGNEFIKIVEKSAVVNRKLKKSV